jgi:hypothetical protein
MAFYQFLWTDEIIKHLAEHDVSQDDFEHVVVNAVSNGLSRASNLPAVWGYTIEGRYLNLIAVFEELEDGTILPVTAYEVPEPR